jgi:large exoprotein involved in heme utilization and adhesion
MVQVGKLTLTDGSRIITSSVGAGQAGKLMVTASEALLITGHDQGGDASGLFSNAGGSGHAGQLLVSAPTLRMEGGRVQAVAEAGSQGNAGSLKAEVGSLTLTEGAQISVVTRSTGQGGQLTVAATEAITIVGADNAGNTSALFSTTRGNGAGGDIRVTAPHIQLRDGGLISARSVSDGKAGTILIQAGDTFHSQQGAVTTEAGQGGGGTIALQAGHLVQLRDSQLTTSVQGGGSDAGNLTLNAPFVLLDGSRVIAQAVEGMGGNLRIAAEVLLADPASLVSASSTRGIRGTVNIQAPVADLSGTVTALPQAFLPATTFLHDQCVARLHAGTVSSFVIRGRASVPATYDGPLPSRLYESPQNRTPPAGAEHPLRETTASSQVPLGSAGTRTPLRLDLPCARP